MSEIMRPISFGRLMDWSLTEYRTRGSIFGVSGIIRYRDRQSLPIFGEKIESPYGPAAGPHTQLAQNIVAAYVAGSRFFELKTVQIIDGEELSRYVPKPCINALDEGYNCEWSTELTVAQAYDEYVKAWFACKLLAQELKLGDPDGFVFNMSVGYDMAGIQSEKIDRYIEGMKDASSSPVWAACLAWTLEHLDRFKRVDKEYVAAISPAISRSITESTLHGCPPEEIERIAAYLMTQKGLHTYVKCNPTLLGYDFVRRVLDELGYHYVQYDDRHFKEDLKREDAFPMFRRLAALGRTHGVEFGIKLTNTFPVDVVAGELPSQEMYLSGRALYPLAVSLAAQIGKEFGGKLRISYSGGADYSNIRGLFQAGIWPITMATNLLKPGGYHRLTQIGELLLECENRPFHGVDIPQVEALAQEACTGIYCRKPIKAVPHRKNGMPLPLLDCFTAPCRSSCPIGQDIPAYLRLVRAGRYEEALEVITQRNPLPFITGAICPHPCSETCMRKFYEGPVDIRGAKLAAAQGGFEALLSQIRPKPARAGCKVAVVGGGPAGMAAAFFLGREGVPVTIYEATGKLGGVVRHIIPEFRIPTAAIDRDEALVRAMGVEVRYHSPISSAKELEGEYTHVIFATGAQKAGNPQLEYGPYVNFTKVLAAIKGGETPRLGSDVAVIGGGNSAMDTARAVNRLPDVEKVRIIYRRTRGQMPAQEEELQMALEEGVEFLELLTPIGVKNRVLTCQVMRLGDLDPSGRRAPVPTGQMVSLPCDTLIAAVGEEIDESVDVGNWPVIGDRKRGPGTVVEAIADAACAAQDILSGLSFDRFTPNNGDGDVEQIRAGRGYLWPEPTGDGQRCLECATACEICREVCPNRANIVVTLPGQKMGQIVHIDGMCNECGNCATFCPYEGRPYRDKFTLYWSRQDFENSENAGWLAHQDGSGRCLIRLGGRVQEYDVTDPNCGLSEGLRQLILAVRTEYPGLEQI